MLLNRYELSSRDGIQFITGYFSLPGMKFEMISSEGALSFGEFRADQDVRPLDMRVGIQRKRKDFNEAENFAYKKLSYSARLSLLE